MKYEWFVGEEVMNTYGSVMIFLRCLNTLKIVLLK